MRDHIEPMSKFQTFRSVIAWHSAMRDAEWRGEDAASAGDKLARHTATDDWAATLEELLAALDHAADIGLLEELSSYLGATYGG